MDHITKEKRSWNMSRITSKNTAPEIIFRKLIHRAGFRYRLHVKTLPGKPDLVLKKYRSTVFVHGCFWHGQENWGRGNKPKTNKKYWKNKIERNIARDKKNVTMLKNAGWNTFIVWECELKKPESVLKRFQKFIKAKGGIARKT
jgi:DNA mismatch endonuclease (patch repair protein)